MDSSVFYRLKNLTNNSIISINKHSFKIGRSPKNDLSINENPYLSSCHCTLEYENGQLFLLDTSSNGTLINRTQKIQKNTNRVQLNSEDILHLVFRKDSPESNVMFQIDLPTLSPFDEDTQMVDYSSIPPASPTQKETHENVDQSNVNTPSYEPKTNVKKVEEPKREFAMDASEDMEDVLTCVCCQDIMSNPITLEPCLHAFCTDCYDSWEAIQRTCPKCRVKVTGKKRNVVINGILEAYLKAFPHKRPEPKLNDDSNKPNKGTHLVGPDGMYLVNIDHDDDEMDDDEPEDDEDDDDEDDNNNNHIGYDPFGAPAVAVAPPPFQYRCRQCPLAIALFALNAPLATTATPGNFQCPQGQNHILCQCCMEPMPDRRDEADIYQHCQICHQFFCHMYFKPCTRATCQGCLNRLRDFHFSPRHLNNLVNNNPVESQIVQDYLINHQLTMRDLLVQCCDRLDRNEFQLAALANTAVPSSKVVCYKCGLNLFKQLAYEFRVRMAADQIHPIAFRQRENCHYGRNCRTQFNKLAHAQKFNHACDQTKF